MDKSIRVSDLHRLEPEPFERFVARVLEISGFSNVLNIGGPGDEGIDLRAEWILDLPTGGKQTTVWAVQCKRYRETLSQGDVQAIISAALEPAPDLFPVPPDYFLLATSSRLSAPATRLLERANRQRSKYSCRFVVWDGHELTRRAQKSPELIDLVVHETPIPKPSVETTEIARLTVLVDHLVGEVVFTFLYESGGPAPTCVLEKVTLSEDDFDRLLEASARLGRMGFVTSFSKSAEEALQELGTDLVELLPPKIRQLAFDEAAGYLRITSNMHLLPFELAYDGDSGVFLADRKRIGRVQIAAAQPIPTWSPQPTALLVAATMDRTVGDLHVPALPDAEKELQELLRILNARGFEVHSLLGADATIGRVAEALSSRDYQMVHFAGHGLSRADGVSGVLLADGVLSYDALSAPHFSGAIVFLNLCSTGDILNKSSVQFFERGAAAMVGFIGPVTDHGAIILATAFYSALVRGASLGSAVQEARQYQRTTNPDDQSRASFVLFGDPAMVVKDPTEEAQNPALSGLLRQARREPGRG